MITGSTTALDYTTVSLPIVSTITQICREQEIWSCNRDFYLVLKSQKFGRKKKKNWDNSGFLKVASSN